MVFADFREHMESESTLVVPSLISGEGTDGETYRSSDPM